MSDLVAEFDSLLQSSDFLFVIYYRGHWCPFCVAYLKSLQSFASEITAANGKPLVVTSEKEVHLVATRTGSKYNGTAIVDTKNILAAELKKRGLIDVAISNKGGYEHGMAQPAVLVIKKDGSILYKWSINPSYMNLGGAKDRPDPKQIWENVNAQLHEKPVAHEKLHTLGIWTGISQAVLG